MLRPSFNSQSPTIIAGPSTSTKMIEYTAYLSYIWAHSLEWEIVSYVLIYVLSLLLLWGFLRSMGEVLPDVLRLLYQWTRDTSGHVDVWVNNVHYPVSYWSEKGGRPYQEDRHNESKGAGEADSSIYGVFDGHAGSRAAQFCKDHLLNYLVKDEDFITKPALALKKTFYRVNQEFSVQARSKSYSDGTTAIVSVIHGKRVYVANVGDSRGIIVQKGGKAKAMSYDHKPNRADEEQRIRSQGGEIIHYGRWRVQGILAISRAIGDVALQPLISCEPEIIEKELNPDDEYLVLASDGVWDVMSNDQVAKHILKSSDFVNCAKDLCSEAMLCGSLDNITALVIDLKRRQKLPEVSTTNSKAKR